MTPRDFPPAIAVRKPLARPLASLGPEKVRRLTLHDLLINAAHARVTHRHLRSQRVQSSTWSTKTTRRAW
jgi:hypothetical protein